MAVSDRLPTEPLREEHRMLLPRIEGLDKLAAEFPGLSAGEARARLFAALEFLHGELVPHASAEEAVLYPAIERVTGMPGSLATMSADHREVLRRIHGLHAAARAPNASLAAIPLALAGLAAIVLLHFRKEEELLLPILDRALAPAEADELFERLARHAHEAAGEGTTALH